MPLYEMEDNTLLFPPISKFGIQKGGGFLIHPSKYKGCLYNKTIPKLPSTFDAEAKIIVQLWILIHF